MNDQPDLDAETLRDTIAEAFLNVYPDLDRDCVHVDLRDDETILVTVADQPSWMAEIASDDDGYLYFGLYDPDYEAEFPDEPRTDPVCLRVRYMEAC